MSPEQSPQATHFPEVLSLQEIAHNLQTAAREYLQPNNEFSDGRKTAHQIRYFGFSLYAFAEQSGIPVDEASMQNELNYRRLGEIANAALAHAQAEIEDSPVGEHEPVLSAKKVRYLQRIINSGVNTDRVPKNLPYVVLLTMYLRGKLPLVPQFGSDLESAEDHED